ncbi:MAG: dUTP diphosphatase, partial [Alphaproteobacteria bacterium]|nr:dUTP diphosphatase [Alphaproteobacteria bacterium]
MTNVKIQKLPHGVSLPLPEYATAHSAGVDLMAAIDADMVFK